MSRCRFGVVGPVVLVAWLSMAPSMGAANPGPQGANTGDGSTPFTGLAQAPEANLFVGAATLSVPIETPPGRGTMTPALALTYNSSLRQTPYGHGWDLPIGKIQRCLKRGVPSCHDAAYRNDFVLELPNGTVECNLHGDGRCYPMVEELFLRIDYDAGDNSWQVLDRDGRRYVFGGTSSARTGSTVDTLFVPAVPSSPTQPYEPCQYTFSWGLTRVEDTSGNDITFEYTSSQGVLYPQHVRYGSNPAGGIGPVFDVAFDWEDYSTRGPLNASAGFAAEISKRLQSIDVRYLGNSVRRYDVTYSPLFTSDPEQPFLRDIMLSSAEGPLLNSVGQPARTTFLYQRDEGDPIVSMFRPAHHAPVLPIDNPSRLRVENITPTVNGVVRDVLDMNRDGFVDLVDMHDCDDPWDVYLGGSAGFSTTPIQWSVPDCVFIRLTDTGGGVANVPIQAFDIDGDGIPDLVDALHACSGFDCDYSYWRVYRGHIGSGSTGWGFDDTYVVWPKPSEPEIEDIYLRKSTALPIGALAGWSNPVVTRRDLIDMNADGLVDLVSTASGTWRIWLNTGAGFEAAAIEFPAPYPFIRLVSNSGDEMIGVYDINGDGLPDQVVGCDKAMHLDCPAGPSGGPLWEVYLNTGHGMRMVPEAWSFGTRHLQAGIRRTQSGRVVRDLFDINGDNLPDVVETRSDNHWNVYLNSAFDFAVEPAIWTIGSNRIRDANNDGLTEKDTFDIDGDGLVDFVDFDPASNDAPVAIVSRRHAFGAWCGSTDGATCSTAAATSVIANPDAGQPGALVQMENGIGGTTYLEYRPSTQWDNGDDDGISRLPLPLWTLTAIESDDGLCDASGADCVGVAGAAHSVRSEFHYRGGFYEHLSREFRGFAAVERRDAGGNLTTTWFHQDSIRRGKVEVTERFAADPVDPYLRPIDNTVQFWQCVNLYDGSDVACPDGSHNEPAWARQAGGQTVTYSNYSLDGAEWTVTSPLAWDQCTGEFSGEATLVAVFSSDDTGALTFTDYACAPGVHVLGKPVHVLTQDGTSPGYSEEKWFLYDGDAMGDPLPYGTLERGLVTRTESWIDTSSSLILSNPCTAQPGKTCTSVRARYDHLGNITAKVDANGRATQIAYTAASHYLYPSLTTNAAGHKVGTGYDVACGKLEWQTQAYMTALAPDDPSHPRTRRRYDSFCRLERTAHADENLDDSPHEVFIYELGAARQPTAMKAFAVEPYFNGTYSPGSLEGQTLPNSHYVPATTLTDALGRPVQRLRYAVVDGAPVNLAAVTMSYDARGLLSQQFLPFVAVAVDRFALPPASVGFEQFSYDSIGRIVTQTNPDGSVRRWDHSVAWQTTAEDECYSDPGCAGAKSIEIRDSADRIVEKQIYKQEAGSDVLAAKTRYSYNALGRLLTSKQWNGSAWDPATAIAHTYDSLGRRLSLNDPDSGLWRYGYDAVGNLRWLDDPKPGQHTQMCYDLIDRITKKYVLTNVDFDESFITCGFAATVEYDYDDASDSNSIGRLAAVDDPSGPTWFTYDVRGRVIGVNKSVAVRHAPPMLDAPGEWASFLYGYDVADHLVSVRYPDGEIVAQGYNTAGMLNRLENDSGKIYLTDLTYDLFGRRRRIVHGDGTVDERAYFTDKAAGHRLRSIATRKGSARYVDLAYTAYTRAGLISRIEDRVRPSSTDPLSSTVTYEYDGLGRLVRAIGNNLPAAPNDRYAYNALGNLTLMEGKTLGYDTAHPHQLKAINGSSAGISHDENGSRLSKPGQTYAYDGEGRLESIDAGAVSVQYDYTGRQVAKYVQAAAQTTRYFNELAESRDGKLIKHYLAGDLRIASRENAAWHMAAAAHDDRMFALARPLTVATAGIAYNWVPTMLATSLLFALCCAPGRRRLGLGLRIRSGQILLLTGIWLTVTLPAPLAFYTPMGGRVAFAFPPGPGCVNCPPDPTTHYHVDHLGSTLVITRGGAVVEYIRYKPYGGVRLRRNGTGATVAATAHPYEFTGYETDSTSGLQYAGARFYDPEVGTFLTHDPQRQFPSPYAYGSWNPVNGVDPDGEFFFLIPVLTLALEALSAVLTAAQALIPQLLTQLQPAVLAAAKGAVTGLFTGSIQAAATGEAKAILEGIKNGAISGAVSGLVFESSGLGEALDGLRAGGTLSVQDLIAPPSDLLAQAGAIGVRGALSGAIRGFVGSAALATVTGRDLRQSVVQGTAGGAIGGAFGNLLQPAVDEISQATVGPITGGVAQALGVSKTYDPSGETFGTLLTGGALRAAAGGALSEAHLGVGKFLKSGLSNFGRFDPRDLAGGATAGAAQRTKLAFYGPAKELYDHHLRPILESPLVNR